jgi:hypothetical protein
MGQRRGSQRLLRPYQVSIDLGVQCDLMLNQLVEHIRTTYPGRADDTRSDVIREAVRTFWSAVFVPIMTGGKCGNSTEGSPPTGD